MRILKPYNLTLEQVRDTLERAIAGTMDCREWDTFLSIPIKGDATMESVRVRCEALSGEESIDADGTIQHSSRAQEELRGILNELSTGPLP